MDKCQTLQAQTKKLIIGKNIKDNLLSMIKDLNTINKEGGYKTNKTRIYNLKKNRSKKNNTLKIGGGDCDYLKISIILSIFSFALYVNRECLETQFSNIATPRLFESINYAIDNYKKSILNLFNISDFYQKFNKGDFSIVQFLTESFGKINLHNLLLEKITNYYTRLKTEPRQSIVDILPKPLTNFLNIFCDLLDAPKREQPKTEQLLQTTELKQQLDTVLDNFKDPITPILDKKYTLNPSETMSDITTIDRDSESTIINDRNNEITIGNLKPTQTIKILISDNDGFFDSC
jgi:hypothetical protein